MEGKSGILSLFDIPESALEEEKDYDETVICQKLNIVKPPIWFFKVNKSQTKLYVYGSNDVMAVLELKNNNKVSRAQLNKKHGIVVRVFGIDERNDTLIEGSSTKEKGFLSVVGSPFNAEEFEALILSVDVRSTGPKTPGLKTAVTEVLVLFATGKLKIFQIDSDKRMTEHNCVGINYWNVFSRAIVAKFCGDSCFSAINTQAIRFWCYREKFWLYPVTKLGYTDDSHPIRAPFALNDKVIISFSKENLFKMSYIFPYKTKYISVTGSSKPTGIVLESSTSAIGFEDGSIEVNSPIPSLVNVKPNVQVPVTFNVVTKRDFYRDGEKPVGPEKLSLDLVFVKKEPFDGVNVYALGSNMKIKSYKIVY